YDRLRERIRSATSVGADNAIYLLEIIEALVDLSGRQPRLRSDAAALREPVEELLRGAEIEDTGLAFRLVAGHFDELFDFAVSIPALPIAQVKGHLSSSGSEMLTPGDLRFYQVAAEYLDQASTVTILRDDWSQTEEALVDGRAAFDLTGAQPILAPSIFGPVTVVVKGFDGVTLWREEFLPSDPQLSD